MSYRGVWVPSTCTTPWHAPKASALKYLKKATPTVRQTIAVEMAAAFAKFSPRPDGLFITSDLGPYVHIELTKIGIIPMKDVQMVAGDTNICAQFPLTPEPVTIRIFSKRIGRQAVELLLQRIKNPDMPQLT
jgi:DNA-binding LacI/PurR family transcriptional regulator